MKDETKDMLLTDALDVAITTQKRLFHYQRAAIIEGVIIAILLIVWYFKK